MWLNIATAGGAVVAGVVGILPTLQPVLTVSTYAWTLFGFAVANIVLRVVTDTAIRVDDDTTKD